MEDSTIQICARGEIRLPEEVRERHGYRSGDTFRLLDLDGILVLTPTVPTVPELAREIERARVEAGLDAESLLRTLREERVRYFAEKFGDVDHGSPPSPFHPTGK